MIASKGCDRLYLQKDGEKTIYIDLPQPLPQHQIDGIRFLYRQHNKKAPGVILNDPSGYGKCMQVTLFLSALQPVLKKPVLILSDSTTNWKEHFETWTGCGNEIIESSNPFTKQIIKINPVKDGFLFSRRSWGIVVLHDEGSTHEFLPLHFNADYKIWITKDDLKENLYTLVSIYEWLHPNQKLNVGDFIAERDNKRDIIEKAVLLDAFLEDFLIRRTDFKTPFIKVECHKRIAKVTSSPTKITRKNKDPTGNKVKRSKKNSTEDDENKTNSVPSKDLIVKNKANIDKMPNDNNMDLEDFIREKEPISCEGFTFIQDNKATTRKNKDPTGTKVKRSKRIDDKNGNVINENIRSEVLDTENVGLKGLWNSKDNKDKRLNKNIVESSICDEKSRNSQDFENSDSPSVTVTVDLPESPDITFGYNTTHKNDNSTNNSKEDADKNSSLVLRYTDTEKLVEDSAKLTKINNAKQSTVIVADTEDNELSDTVAIQKDSEVQEIGVFIPETESSENSMNDFDKIKLIKEEKPSMTKEKNIDNISNNKQDSKINNELDKSYTNTVDDLDAKLAELEAKALQRLKSSILDSLF